MGELCVPGCRYRQLYEGSQTSLGDMASKQARSVTEHRQLRLELSRLLKRYFPREYQTAERSLGVPMADAEDEVVVACLDQVLAARHLDGGLAGLRAALVAAGFDLTTDDVDQWAEAVRRGPAGAPAVAAPGAATAVPAAQPAPGAQPSPAASPAPSPTAVTGHGPTPDGPGGGTDVLDQLLSDLGASVPATFSHDNGPPPDDQAYAHDMDPQGGLGYAGATDDLEVDDLGDLDLDDDLDDLFNPGAYDEPHDTGELPGVPAPVAVPAPEAPAAPAARGVPAASAVPAPGTTALDDIFAELPATAGGSLDDLFGDGAAPSDGQFQAPAQPQAQVSPAGAAVGLDDLFGVAPGDGADPPAGPSGKTMPLPLKPEVVSAAKKRPGRKTARTRATRGDVPENEAVAGPLDDKTRTALLASVAIPRPVFVADLAAVAGSLDLVEVWEAEMRELRTGAPVRFIGGKPRHRRRGSLVIPHGALREASAGAGASWWSECLGQDAYRGSKLYELAVLLHRVGTDVVASDFDADAAVLRVNEERGLVGLVVVLSDDLAPGGATHERLRSALGALVRERLGLVAVLSTNAEWETALSQTVEELARAERWVPNAPVVYSTTWEWADDAGSTAKLLVGG